MGEENIGLLKSEVEKTLGRKILTSTECRYLFISLSALQSKVSFNTLRRFFGLLKSDYFPSTYTLDVLSNYCGYSSYNDFCNSHRLYPDMNEAHIDEDLINYLVANFKTELKNNDSQIFTNFVDQTIKFLERHPHLIDSFQRKIAVIKNGQLFYYEQSIYFDKLNSFYGDGLRYYMIAKNEMSSHFFGCYLLGFKNWLVMDNQNIEKYYKMVCEIDIESTGSFIIQAYKYCLQLFYLNAFGYDVDFVLIKLKQLQANNFVSPDNYRQIFQYKFHLINTLILCSQYEEALLYIEDVIKIKNKYDLAPTDQKLYECIAVYKCIALHETGNITEALKLFNTIDPSAFHFLYKQYLTILYLAIKQNFQKIKSDYILIKSLIAETGFSRLNNFLNIQDSISLVDPLVKKINVSIKRLQ